MHSTAASCQDAAERDKAKLLILGDVGAGAQHHAQESGAVVSCDSIPLQRIREGMEGCTRKAILVDVGERAT